MSTLVFHFELQQNLPLFLLSTLALLVLSTFRPQHSITNVSDVVGRFKRLGLTDDLALLQNNYNTSMY